MKGETVADEPAVGFVTMGDAASEGDIPTIGIGMLGYAFMARRTRTR
jgi:hypothetical protein